MAWDLFWLNVINVYITTWNNLKGAIYPVVHVLEKKDKYFYNVAGAQISRANSSQFTSLRVT